MFKDYFKDVKDFFYHKETKHIHFCYLCGAEKHDTYNRLHEHLYQCSDCGFVWLAKRPKDDDLEEFYTASAAMTKWAGIKSGNADLLRQHKKYEFFYDHITNMGLNDVLDIGCGTGKFLANLPDGTKSMGVEPNKDSRDLCQTNVVASVTEVKGRFDMITYMGVLEHLTDPKQVIYENARHLSDDGFIGIVVPNIESLAFKILKEKNCTICPQHLYYYSIDSLTELLDQCGFEHVKFATVEAELQPIIKMERYGDPYLDLGWNFKHDTFTEDGIINKCQGAKILAIFKRRDLNE